MRIDSVEGQHLVQQIIIQALSDFDISGSFCIFIAITLETVEFLCYSFNATKRCIKLLRGDLSEVQKFGHHE